MKSNRLLFHLMLILCCSCFFCQVWAASPPQPGASQQNTPGVSPKKTMVKATPVQKPDLVIAAAQFGHAPKSGEQLGTDSILNIQIKNQGTVQAGPTTVKITCSATGGTPCPAGLSGTLTCSGLAPNQSATLPWPGSGGSWAAGSYKLAIEADFGHGVAESVESNNLMTLNVVVPVQAGAVSVQGGAGAQFSNTAGSNLPVAASGNWKPVKKLQASQGVGQHQGPGVQNAAVLKLRLTSPENGAALIGGSGCQITWDDPLKQAQAVKITLHPKGNAAIKNIANNVPNTGSYSWKVDVTMTPGKHDYTLKVQGVGQNADYSDTRDISIYVPKVTITSPTPNEIWTATENAMKTITWKTEHMPASVFGSRVRVSLCWKWALPYGANPSGYGYALSTHCSEYGGGPTENDGTYTYTGAIGNAGSHSVRIQSENGGITYDEVAIEVR